jgi:hypothetical protein
MSSARTTPTAPAIREQSRSSQGPASPPLFSLRFDELTAKIERGESLTNDERAERQGIIFNHSGKASGVQVI